MSLIAMGNLGLPLMVGLGATIGIPMGMEYPFPIAIKTIMAVGLLVSVIAMTTGFNNRDKLWGQVIAISGILTWTFIGLIGLGTGT